MYNERKINENLTVTIRSLLRIVNIMDPAMQLEVAAMSRQQIIRDASALGDSDVQRFYCGRIVFLTGGSGFLGKQLIEKLLRSCRISKVYMLLRPKKGKTIKERFDDLMSEPVYDALQKEQPDFRNKIVPIPGDVSEIKLGINYEDWKTITEEVDVIFHVAATTKFDETLRVATLINIRGTRECLRLGRACKNLRSYVHISTAYTHTTSKNVGEMVDEKFYDSPIPPENMISMAVNMDNEILKRMTPDLIKGWPNTYAFTKAVTEKLIQKTSDGLPICIVKPGVVLSSMREPSPGWLDTTAVYSATGILLGIGLGAIHTVPVDINVNVGFIPCDYVNNAAIVAGKEVANMQAKGGNDTKIYIVTSTCRNPINWYKMAKIIREDCSFSIPTPHSIYYSYMIETGNSVLFGILTLLLHIIPACIADFICLLIGKKRRFLKLAKKVYNMSKTLSYFWFNEWAIVDHNTAALYESLSNRDKIIFNFDVTDINWKEFIIIWCLGIRKYIIKDGLKDTEYAIKKQKWFEILHYVITPLYAYALWKLTHFVFSTIFGIVFTGIGYVS